MLTKTTFILKGGFKVEDDYKITVPLEIDLIDEGRFTGNMNKELTSLQTQLISHVKRHGHKAEKAKAKLTIEIVLACVDVENEAYACVTQMQKALPQSPAQATLLMEGKNQEGQPRLLCRRSGSSYISPEQKLLFTKDGRPVDIASGEIVGSADEAIQEAIEQQQQEQPE